MALMDFLEKFADHATSDRMQQRMKDGYNRGRISQDSYDKYRDAVDNYKSRKPPKDDYDY